MMIIYSRNCNIIYIRDLLTHLLSLKYSEIHSCRWNFRHDTDAHNKIMIEMTQLWTDGYNL